MSAVTRQTDPRALARLLTFRHGNTIERLRLMALQWPWDGRTQIHPTHKADLLSVTDDDLRISLIFTLDRGAHASGWWRNSQYETCLHLSIAARTTELSPQLVEAPAIERRAWAFAMLGEDATKAWNEPPAGENDPHRSAPASRSTWHTRLFLDQHMHPIIPTGEVYTLIPFEDGSSPDKIHR
ncbi:MAG: hypothetical protein K0S37_3007 [Microbacterium sp.]|jgi:hypothetical protein|nr:hypothetical protein [Microbacterium sp.]